MRALVLRKPGQADLATVADPALTDTNVLLKVRFVGFCGSDLNSFRGLNPLVTYPRILGHEYRLPSLKTSDANPYCQRART